jgi:Abi-like protein
MPILTQHTQNQILATLTPPRMRRYLDSAKGDAAKALKLYAVNAQVAAALLFDLHFVEVTLRNKIDFCLATSYGTNWASDTRFLALLSQPDRQFLQKHTAKYGGANLVCNLSFGFWISLLDRRYTHTLWVPHLRKIFASSKAPSRAAISAQLEQLRQLRNRIAHHEPIFHLPLNQSRLTAQSVVQSLCPSTAYWMLRTSKSKRAVMGIQTLRKV